MCCVIGLIDNQLQFPPEKFTLNLKKYFCFAVKTLQNIFRAENLRGTKLVFIVSGCCKVFCYMGDVVYYGVQETFPRLGIFYLTNERNKLIRASKSTRTRR